ncbi:hypothetical protein ACVRWQ_01665 [Streptococcus phocae subsp. salmonis]
MLKNIQQFEKKYSNHIIAITLIIWIILIVTPARYLGENYYIRNKILLEIFPIIGIIITSLSILGKNLKLLLLGISLIFSFYITMLIGYMIIGG